MPYADPVVSKEYHRQYLFKQTEEQKAANRERNRRYAVTHREQRKAHYLSRKSLYQAYERNRQYKKMYGVTLDDYNRMFAEQGGKCAICGGHQRSKTGRLVHFCIDHCHKTGKVRGLLCNGCNRAVGHYEFRQTQIDAYLEKYS